MHVMIHITQSGQVQEFISWVYTSQKQLLVYLGTDLQLQQTH